MIITIGTPAQIGYAEKLYQARLARGEKLPDRPDASFWLDNQKASAADLWELAAIPRPVTTPYTKQYPWHSREEAQHWIKELERGTLAFCDSETTGLNEGLHKLVAQPTEIALVAETGSVIDYYDIQCTSDAYVEPTNPIPVKLEGTITLADAWHQGLGMTFDLYHTVWWNTRFDLGIIFQTLARADIYPRPVDATDLMPIASVALGYGERLTQEAACQLLGIDQLSYGEPHTAVADAKVLAAIYRALRYGLF